MMSTVNIDNLAATIAKELGVYRQDVADGIKDNAKAVAKECRQDIQQNSPKLTGSYKKGWRIAAEHESRDDIRITVYNKTDPQLTHLIENGHAGRGGIARGAASPHPHIRPAEQRAEEKLLGKAKVVVKG